MFDNAAVVTVLCFIAFVVAYFTYGRFLAAKVFRLDSSRPTPAYTREDGVDFVPTPASVLFGHHFASIAGLGPILGPALAVNWGWAPAVLWVVFGCIFVGAVHDLGAMAVSLRYQGRSIGDLCKELLGARARVLFLLIIFFAMSLAMGAFVNAIGNLFVDLNPDAVIPSAGLMLVAMAFGVYVYRMNGDLTKATVVSLVLFGGLILWGSAQPIRSYEWFASAETAKILAEGRAVADQAKQAAAPSGGRAESAKVDSAAVAAAGIPLPYGADQAAAYLAAKGDAAAQADLKQSVAAVKFWWIMALLAYGFLASVLPVWLLLQPRDYINSFQLYFALGALLLGVVVAGVTGHSTSHIQAEAFRTPAGGESMPVYPFLFITIACGAVSGFHCLVSSGTTARQIKSEGDALPVGFGGMLVEGALAILVIMACVAGLGAEAWGPSGVYADFTSMNKLSTALNAVVRGGANYLALLGVPLGFGASFLAVTIAAFALTTLDSATRLLRFNVEELFISIGLPKLAERNLCSLIAVVGIGAFGFLSGKELWNMFGTINQLLAGLTLLATTVFLYHLNRPILFTAVPMVLMLGTTATAMTYQLVGYFKSNNYPLALVSISLIILTVWMVVEAVNAFRGGRRDLGLDAPPAVAADERAAASSHIG